MAQRVKVTDASNQSLIPDMHMVEGENQLEQVALYSPHI